VNEVTRDAHTGEVVVTALHLMVDDVEVVKISTSMAGVEGGIVATATKPSEHAAFGSGR
jgi:hypothetical protein